jgi:hypothetical protein
LLPVTTTGVTMNGTTEILRTRHVHLASILGGLLLWVGATAMMTVAGIIVGIPVALAGIGLLTTPHPH